MDLTRLCHPYSLTFVVKEIKRILEFLTIFLPQITTKGVQVSFKETQTNILLRNFVTPSLVVMFLRVYV